jgi:acyl carrier protein
MKKSQPEISKFIVRYISRKLQTNEEGVPVNEPLTNLGLSSREAVVLTAELEEFLGRPVDPALPWEHPTIEKLSEHLAGLS